MMSGIRAISSPATKAAKPSPTASAMAEAARLRRKPALFVILKISSFFPGCTEVAAGHVGGLRLAEDAEQSRSDIAQGAAGL